MQSRNGGLCVGKRIFEAAEIDLRADDVGNGKLRAHVVARLGVWSVPVGNLRGSFGLLGLGAGSCFGRRLRVRLLR